jgi:hypothetical protein
MVRPAVEAAEELLPEASAGELVNPETSIPMIAQRDDKEAVSVSV